MSIKFKLGLLLVIMLILNSCKPSSSSTVTGLFDKILEPVSYTINTGSDFGEMVLSEEEVPVLITVSNNSSDEIRNIYLDVDVTENLINFEPLVDGTIASPGLGGTCKGTILPGKECTFKLIMIPRKQGEFNVRATINYINKIEPQKKDINFHLIAGEPASLVFTSNTSFYSFGVIEQTEVVERTKVLEVQNAGGLPARNLEVLFENDELNPLKLPYKLISHNCPTKLNINQKCQITVSHIPQNNNYNDPEQIDTAKVLLKYTNDPIQTLAQLNGYFTTTASTIEAKLRANYKAVDFTESGAPITTGNKKRVSIKVTNFGYREGELKAIIFRQAKLETDTDPNHKGKIAAICVKAPTGNILDCRKKTLNDFKNIFYNDADIANELTASQQVAECTNCDNKNNYDFPFIVEDRDSCFGNIIYDTAHQDATHSSSCSFYLTFRPSVNLKASDRTNLELNLNQSTIDFRLDTHWKGLTTYYSKEELFKNTATYSEKASFRVVDAEKDSTQFADVDSMITKTTNGERINLGRIEKLASNATDFLNYRIVFANEGETNFNLLKFEDESSSPTVFFEGADLSDTIPNSFYTGVRQNSCATMQQSTYVLDAMDPLKKIWSNTCSVSYELQPKKQSAAMGKTGSEIETEKMYDTVVKDTDGKVILQTKNFIFTYDDGSRYADYNMQDAEGAFATDQVPLVESKIYKLEMKSILVAVGKLVVASSNVGYNPANPAATITLPSIAVGDSKVYTLKLSNVGTGSISAIQFKGSNSPLFDNAKYALQVGNSINANKFYASDYFVSKCASPSNSVFSGGIIGGESYCPVNGSIDYGAPSLYADERKFPFRMRKFSDIGKTAAQATGDPTAIDCADLVLKTNINIVGPGFTPPGSIAWEDFKNSLRLPEDTSCYMRIEIKAPKNSFYYDNSSLVSFTEYTRFWASNVVDTEDIWMAKAVTPAAFTMMFKYWTNDINFEDPNCNTNFGYIGTSTPQITLKQSFTRPANVVVSDMQPIASSTYFRPVIEYPCVPKTTSCDGGDSTTDHYPNWNLLKPFYFPPKTLNAMTSLPNDYVDTDVEKSLFSSDKLKTGLAAAANLSPNIIRVSNIRKYHKEELGNSYYSGQLSNVDRPQFFLGAFEYNNVPSPIEHLATLALDNVFSDSSISKFRLEQIIDGSTDTGIFYVKKFMTNTNYVYGTDIPSSGATFTGGTNSRLTLGFILPSSPKATPYRACFRLYYESNLIKSGEGGTRGINYDFCVSALARHTPKLKIEYQNWNVGYDTTKNPIYSETPPSDNAWKQTISPVNRIENYNDEYGNILVEGGSAVNPLSDSRFTATFSSINSSATCDTSKNCSYDLKYFRLTNTGSAALKDFKIDLITNDLQRVKIGSNNLTEIDDVASPNTLCSKKTGDYFANIKGRFAYCKSDLNSCQNLAPTSSCTLRLYFMSPSSSIAIVNNLASLKARIAFSYATDYIDSTKGTYANQFLSLNYESMDTIKATVAKFYRQNIESYSTYSGLAVGGSDTSTACTAAAISAGTCKTSSTLSIIKNYSVAEPTVVTSLSSDLNNSIGGWYKLDLESLYGNKYSSSGNPDAYNKYVLESASKVQTFYATIAHSASTSSKISFLRANDDPEAHQTYQTDEKSGGWYQVYPSWNTTTNQFNTFNAKHGASKAKIYANIKCFYGDSSKADTTVESNDKGFGKEYDGKSAAEAAGKICQLKINFSGDFTYSTCSTTATEVKFNTHIGGNIDTTNCTPYAYKIPVWTYKRLTDTATLDLFITGFIEPNRSKSTSSALLTNIATKAKTSTTAEFGFTIPNDVVEKDSALGSIAGYRIYWSSNATATGGINDPEIFKYNPDTGTTPFRNNTYWYDVDASTRNVTINGTTCSTGGTCKVDPLAYYYIRVMAIRNIVNTNPNYNLGKTNIKKYISDTRIPIAITTTPNINGTAIGTFYNSTYKYLIEQTYRLSAGIKKYDSSTPSLSALKTCSTTNKSIAPLGNTPMKLIDINAWNFLRTNASNSDYNTGYPSNDLGQIPHWIFEATPKALNVPAQTPTVPQFDGVTRTTSLVFPDFSPISSSNPAYQIMYKRASSSSTYNLYKVMGGLGGEELTQPNYVHFIDSTITAAYARCMVELKCPLDSTKLMNDSACKFTQNKECKTHPSCP